MSDVEGLRGDDSVLDMLKAVGADGFVVHAETAPGNRLDLDTGFTRPALGALDARFEVEELLGSSGFSKVYRGFDTVEGEQRALKLFDTAAGYDAVRREISALRKVDHPNVVKVIWADKTEQGEWYLIMVEYIHGELLADYATGKKQQRDREAIDVALDVLSAHRHPPGQCAARRTQPEEVEHRARPPDR